MKGVATHWLTGPEYEALRRLQAALAMAEAAYVKARWRPCPKGPQHRDSGAGSSSLVLGKDQSSRGCTVLHLGAMIPLLRSWLTWLRRGGGPQH